MYMYKYTGARRKQGKKLKGKENAKAANYPVHQKKRQSPLREVALWTQRCLRCSLGLSRV